MPLLWNLKDEKIDPFLGSYGRIDVFTFLPEAMDMNLKKYLGNAKK